MAKFNLIVNPDMADYLTNGEGNRVARLAREHRFHINLVRDTTIPQQEFIVTDLETGQNLTRTHEG